MSILRSAALVAALLLPIGSNASDLDQTIARLEGQLDARIGVAILDSGTGQDWTHRPDERFLMNSTVKVPLCAAILSRDDLGLTEVLPVRAEDILEYAPVTERHVGGAMTIADLCLAAVDQSDNTATNILFDRLGGPEQLTAFLRGIGDSTTRSDRIEPALNTFVAGDPRDTTTPAAMVRTLEVLFTGDALSPDARTRLTSWMRPGGVTGALIRPAVPAGWDVADKSGSGENNRNLIAMLTPPDGAPIFVSLSISDTKADFATRNAALIELGAAVMEILTAG
jgi:beta-lactamase class A